MCGGNASRKQHHANEAAKRAENEARNAARAQQEAFDKAMAEQAAENERRAAEQQEQFRIAREAQQAQWEADFAEGQRRFDESMAQARAQAQAQSDNMAAMMQAQREAEERARLEAEKARNRSRSFDAATKEGVVARNKDRAASRKRAKAGTRQLTNPLSALAINNLGLGGGGMGTARSGGLTIAQVRRA